MSLFDFFRRNSNHRPVYDVAGSGRRSFSWSVSNPGPNDFLNNSLDQLRAKSRDQVRRNVWASAGIDAFVSNAIGSGIKPQSLICDDDIRKQIQSLWWIWADEADSAGIADFYGLQSLVCRSMMEGGECFVRICFRKESDDLSVPLQLQILESEHVPIDKNGVADNGNTICAGIEFDKKGKRVAYYIFPNHPNDSSSFHDKTEAVRVPANNILHIFKPLRPGQVRGEPWLSRALVKLEELDQYDDAELMRKKTAAMFAGFITRQNIDDNFMGESEPDSYGISTAGLEPGTLQILEPGEDIKFSDPADLGNAYSDFMRQQFRAVSAAMGITYEMLTGDLTEINYSSIRAGLLEFRRRCEAIQHSIIIYQLCRPVWNVWMNQVVLSGKINIPDYSENWRNWCLVKWIPQGWQWVDPQKEFNAMKIAIRSGLMSRSEAIAAFGYDAEDIDREIASDNLRADDLGLVFESDPRHDNRYS